MIAYVWGSLAGAIFLHIRIFMPTSTNVSRTPEIYRRSKQTCYFGFIDLHSFSGDSSFYFEHFYVSLCMVHCGFHAVLLRVNFLN